MLSDVRGACGHGRGLTDSDGMPTRGLAYTVTWRIHGSPGMGDGAVTLAAMASRESDWEGVRLHVVTGKGGTGKTTVAAALALALAGAGPPDPARRGRGPAGHRPALRRTAAALRGAQGRRRARRRRRRSRSRSTRGGAARVPRHVLQARPRRSRAAPDRRHRLRDHDRAGHARRAAHRQGLRGGAPQAGRRRPVYDAVVLDAPPTGRITRFLGRQRRGGRAGQGRADPQPGRLDHGAAHARRRPPCTW